MPPGDIKKKEENLKVYMSFLVNFNLFGFTSKWVT